MNSTVRQLIVKLILVLNERAPLIRMAAKFICNVIDNVNNSDINSNGERNVIRQYMPKVTQLFDVGAGDGEYLNYCLKENKNIKVFAFEPSERFHNIEQISNIVRYNIGLGKVEGTLNLYLNNSGGAPSLVKSAYLKGSESKTIRIMRFDKVITDEILDKNINYLKIDVEGFEMEVLQGMDNYIRKGYFKYIQFEYSGFFYYNNIKLIDLFNYIKSLNITYFLYKIYQNNVVEVESILVEHENYQEANYIFIKRDF